MSSDLVDFYMAFLPCFSSSMGESIQVGKLEKLVIRIGVAGRAEMGVNGSIVLRKDRSLTVMTKSMWWRRESPGRAAL